MTVDEFQSEISLSCLKSLVLCNNMGFVEDLLLDAIKACPNRVRSSRQIASYVPDSTSFDFEKACKEAEVSSRTEVAVGNFGMYHTYFGAIQWKTLFLFERLPEGGRLVYTFSLVGSTIELLKRNRFILTSPMRKNFWFRFSTKEDYEAWLLILQDVIGVRKKLTDFYEVDELLGKGAGCSVHKCTNKFTGKTYALKARHDVCNEFVRLGLFNELKILLAISTEPHPAIPFIKDYFVDEDRNIKIMMELIEGEDLLTKLTRDGPLAEEKAVLIFRQIAEGIRHLHQHCIGHRDIKPSNVMISNSNERIQCRVIDFDLARIHKGDTWLASEVCGTVNYMAPEVLDSKIYTLAVDTWSLGCLLFELLTGQPTFTGRTSFDKKQNILQGRFDDTKLGTVSVEARDLIQKMLDLNPTSRPTLQEVLCSYPSKSEYWS